MKYFRDCQTIEDVKQEYKRLAKQLHPDCGGDAEEFKRMQADYQTAFNRYKNYHRNMEGETYEKETQETPEEFAEIINKIIHFEGVTIEIIGSWCWVCGQTMQYKEILKDAGFWWSKSKRAWYWNGDKEKTKRRGRYSMSQLRERYGTIRVDTEEQEKIAG